jgi:hypothetical protein
MASRQTNIAPGQRLLQADWQPVLVAAGNERRTGCGTDGRVGVCLQEPQTLSRQAIDVGGSEVRTAVTRNVGITEIISHDKNDVRTFRSPLTEYDVKARGERKRPKGGVPQHRTAAWLTGDLHLSSYEKVRPSLSNRE